MIDSGTLGLIELVLVFALLLGFGLWQLYSVRRDQRRADAERARREAEGKDEGADRRRE